MLKDILMSVLIDVLHLKKGKMNTHFKIGKRTPHIDNDCTGVHFIIEDNVLEILERGEPCCSNNAPTANIHPTCSVISSVYQLHFIDSESIADQRDCQLDIAKIESSVTLQNSAEKQCICIEEDKDLSSDLEIEDLQSKITRMSKLTNISKEPLCKMRRLTNPK